MKIETEITHIQNGEEFIRGVSLLSMIENMSFSKAIFFLIKGTEPNEEELKTFNALLVAAIDHSPGTASAQTARITASAKNSVHVSLATGILTMGERHGGAIENAAKFFVDCEGKNILEEVTKYKDVNKYLPGFGHAALEVDLRSKKLFEIAKQYNVYGTYSEIAENVHVELNNISSKKLPLNIDGAMAAILLDLGFPVDSMKAIFIIARMPGLSMQVIEEQRRDIGLRRLSNEDIIYIGK